MKPPTLPQNCPFCGKKADEVLAYEDGKPIRTGWLCTACWPKEGAWTQAIGRERVVREDKQR